jgi:hypothetical protein
MFSAAPDVVSAEPELSVDRAVPTEAPPAPPAPVFVAQDPPQFVSPPPPPAPMTQTGPVGFSFSEAPDTGLASPSSLPTAAISAETAVHVNGSDPLAASEPIEDEPVFTSDPAHQFDSAASMATEILSAAPEAVVTEAPPGAESELISKDMTLIARDRRKRFRLR